jgi:hypothetical protein
MKMITLLTILLVSNAGMTQVLPEIIYASSSEKESFCRNSDHESETYWRKLISDKISGIVQGEDEVIQNSYVSLSYLELFRLSSHDPSKFMGYVYANASDHLGRLVRFTKWPENHPGRDADRKLVKGFALRMAAGTVNHELSKRLMNHSLKLYQELAWSLAAASVCGSDYALRIVQDENLRKAFQAIDPKDFIRPFVTYEQTYLQKTMYSDFLIGSSARAKVLDEMRFISWNGEEHTAFGKWCKDSSCGTTSFDLQNRIEFDVWSIEAEFDSGGDFDQRISNALVESTALIFVKNSL